MWLWAEIHIYFASLHEEFLCHKLENNLFFPFDLRSTFSIYQDVNNKGIASEIFCQSNQYLCLFRVYTLKNYFESTGRFMT